MKRMREGDLGDAAPLRHVNGLIWKKRLGDLRILFTYDTRQKEIVVRAILWRREDTYADLEKMMPEIEKEKATTAAKRKAAAKKVEIAKKKADAERKKKR